MKPVPLSDATRIMKAPRSWDEAEGPCEDLHIYDYQSENGPVMVSVWMLEEEELIALRSGAILYLHIHAMDKNDPPSHPVVGLAIQNA